MKYNDLSLSMKPHPFSGDLLAKTDSESIKQSVKTLVMMNFYDKPFAPRVAGGVTGFLFDLAGPAEKLLLQTAITEVITRFEPRADLHEVITDVVNDTIRVKVVFSLLNSDIPVSVEFFLNRIR